MKTIILALLLLSSSAFADEWTTGDTYRQAVFQTLMVIDWSQTRGSAETEWVKYYEKNPILGDHPSVFEVDRYFIAASLVHFSVAYVLPQDWRRAFQYVSIGIETNVVAQNFSIGVRGNF